MTAIKPTPSQALLRRLFDYNQKTGILTWREGRRTGNRAGYQHNVIGKPQYRYVWLHPDTTIDEPERAKFPKLFKEHRIIWKWMTGEEPPYAVDHVNGTMFDNQWKNLRAADRSDNSRNVRTRSRHGFHGATFHKFSGLWTSRIRWNGRMISLGYYTTPQEASAAYTGAARFLKAVDGYGFFPDHV
jgi:hypothetical protein